MLKALSALDEPRRASLVVELEQLIGRLNRARDGKMVVPGEYLEVVIIKK